jgi:16S rRNA G1207 methylase RsmC
VQAPPAREADSERAALDKEFRSMREQLKAGVQVVSANQLFPTPAALAARMVEMADVQDGEQVMEPSAGTGRILQALRETGKRVHVVAVEINTALADALKASHQARPDTPQQVSVVTADFLTLGAAPVFDAVLMNPPFANGDDIKHITHALRMLKPGGRLVAICANGPRQRAQLMPLVEQHGGEWEELPRDTFAEEGTNVGAALLALTA